MQAVALEALRMYFAKSQCPFLSEISLSPLITTGFKSLAIQMRVTPLKFAKSTIVLRNGKVVTTFLNFLTYIDG